MRRLFLLCLSITSGVASAQTFGEITGEVKDQSGAVAPNVVVTATNTATHLVRNTTVRKAYKQISKCRSDEVSSESS